MCFRKNFLVAQGELSKGQSTLDQRTQHNVNEVFQELNEIHFKNITVYMIVKYHMASFLNEEFKKGSE